jgi:hypothetical protein
VDHSSCATPFATQEPPSGIEPGEATLSGIPDPKRVSLPGPCDRAAEFTGALTLSSDLAKGLSRLPKENAAALRQQDNQGAAWVKRGRGRKAGQQCVTIGTTPADLFNQMAGPGCLNAENSLYKEEEEAWWHGQSILGSLTTCASAAKPCGGRREACVGRYLARAEALRVWAGPSGPALVERWPKAESRVTGGSPLQIVPRPS